MSRNRTSSRNNPDEHFTSPVAYRLEEAYLSVRDILVTYKGDITPRETEVLRQIAQRLTTLYRREYLKKGRDPLTLDANEKTSKTRRDTPS